MAGSTDRAQNSNDLADVINSTYRTILRKSEELLSEEDLTRPQFQALRFVAEKGATPMKGISEKLSVTPANVTGIIDRLESKGLLKRGAHAGDRRATIIELTAKGAAVQERVASKYKGFVRGSLKALSRDEQKMLREILLKLQEGMSQAVR
jgi:MarR family transcriptional regulator, organic hydroperoxide resistance regulator